MQTINFSPLEFQNFRQQEAEARRRQYGSFSDMFNGIGNTAEKMGAAQQRYDDSQKAEEWRQKQWNHQRWQEEDERKRREEQERLDRESADKLRNEFMGKYGNMDLSGYGLPAQFAMDRIRNARTWQEVVGGGNALTQAIQYQDTLRGQQEEQQRERFVPNFIKDYDTRLAYENQVDFNKPEQTALGYSMKELGTKYSNLMGEKEDLEALIISNPAYKSPEVIKRLNGLDAMTKILRRRIMAIRHPGVTVF